MIDAPAPGMTGPGAAGCAANVVAAGTIIYGVPAIFVVSPERPAGAALTGICVGPGIMTWAGPTGCGSGPATGAGVLAGGPPNMELIIAPKAGIPGGFS
jgi:hypothetical protein